jgi:cytoskeletal protein CcmA (bactofilin family)
MPSANPEDRSFLSSAIDDGDDEQGSTQHMPMPSRGQDSLDWLDRRETDQDPDEPLAQGYVGTAEKLSVLGPTVHFKGELTADEDLMIQGQIEGSIRHHARHLTIGTKGRVKADIHANHIIVQGEVEGDMFGTEAVIIEASARVRGNVFAPRVALKEGAKFKGGIDMDASEPAAQAADGSAESKRADAPRRRKSSAKESATDAEVNELLE